MYRVKRSLSHADDQREDHKYVARVETKNPKNKWRYFYSLADYKAYLKSKEAKKDKVVSTQLLSNSKKSSASTKKEETKSTTTRLKRKVDTGKDILNKLVDAIAKNQNGKVVDKKNLSKTLKVASEKIEKVVKNVTSKETVEKGKTVVENLLKKVDKVDDKLLSNGKKAVEKAIKSADNKIDKIVSDASKTLVDVGKKAVGAYNLVTDYNVAELASSFVKNMVGGFLGQNVSPDYKYEWTDYTHSTTAEQEQPASLADLKKKDTYMTKDQDMAEINPMYYTNEFEWTNNCAHCTAAYDLRQRGYDVEAAPIDPMDANYADTIMNWYDGAELIHSEDFSDSYTVNDSNEQVIADALEKDLAKYGDGARGHLLLYWEGGGGHDVIWEVENGDVKIRDCQSNRTYDLIDYVQYTEDVAYFRSDNLNVNENILKTVRNKK